ncbi:MAG: hypothetical protein COA79_25720 [Planctomycetota bacterium]|nr:MAG: hypothetical protein COA79_25720 [Planctomycetota bacterium]
MSLDKKIQISDAEWEVMKVVWELKRPTSGEIISCLNSNGFDWSPKTIRTMITRLVKKNEIKCKEEDGLLRYSSIKEKDRLIKDAGKRFLKKIFDGGTSNLLLHFVNNTDLSNAEIEELQKSLDQKRDEQKK